MKTNVDTSDEAIRQIAEDRNLAIWWFDQDYVRRQLEEINDEVSDEYVARITSDLAGDAGVMERIAEEVCEYIQNYDNETIDD